MQPYDRELIIGFLKQLQEDVLTARLRDGSHVRDASDVRAWIAEKIQALDSGDSMDELFGRQQDLRSAEAPTPPGMPRDKGR